MAQESGPQVYARVGAVVPGHRGAVSFPATPARRVLARGTRQEGVASLQKPFTPKALAQRVREVLDDGRREARTG